MIVTYKIKKVIIPKMSFYICQIRQIYVSRKIQITRQI